MSQESTFLKELEEIIKERKSKLPEGSYTTTLFKGGLDRILKKIGEEAGEVIIASKNNSSEELIYESADLLYHLIVLWAEQGVELTDIIEELEKRHRPTA
jgi:phosphoribosyl-ATP pyrophosphohydrolase